MSFERAEPITRGYTISASEAKYMATADLLNPFHCYTHFRQERYP
jgi:hypothetical protein